MSPFLQFAIALVIGIMASKLGYLLRLKLGVLLYRI